MPLTVHVGTDPLPSEIDNDGDYGMSTSSHAQGEYYESGEQGRLRTIQVGKQSSYAASNLTN
jgi:hypothetical protein